MTTILFNKLVKNNFITINHNMMAEQAIERIKNSAYDKNSSSILYVVDDNECLVGLLNINTLLVSNFFSKISEIMEEDYDFIEESTLNNNNLIDKFSNSGMIELAVLNSKKEILGIIDIHTVLNNQNFHGNGFHKSEYISSIISNVKNSSIFMLYKSRIYWLVILVFMNIFSGAGIAIFEDLIASSIALVFFLPLLIDSAGNAGTQSSTLVIRSFALGNVKLKDWFSLFSKETLISLFIGITMALAVYPLGIWRGGFELAIIVAITMVLVVMIGSLIGISLPFIFQLLKLDPATASGPLVTSIADIVGVFVYFYIASMIINLN